MQMAFAVYLIMFRGCHAQAVYNIVHLFIVLTVVKCDNVDVEDIIVKHVKFSYNMI